MSQKERKQFKRVSRRLLRSCTLRKDSVALPSSQHSKGNSYMLWHEISTMENAGGLVIETFRNKGTLAVA